MIEPETKSASSGQTSFDMFSDDLREAQEGGSVLEKQW